MAQGRRALNAGDAVDPAPARPSFSDRIRSWRRRHTFALGLLALTIVFVIAVAIPKAVVNVPAGHVAVLWKRFLGGTVTNYHLDEGIHLIFPWDRAYIYDARLRTIVRTYDTISSNGLSMSVEIATRYRINKNSVGTLHKQIGPDYPDILLNPEIGSNAREVISRYTPEQLYSDARSFIQAQILERMVTQLGSSLISQSPSGQLVFVEDTLIRSVGLPQSVVEAIERKAQQYHVMLEYDFRIEREELERQRKNIEAKGIREFQEIVSGTITDEYLRLRGIDATLAIASSNNSKIVVMGGPDGLPVILNTGEFENSVPPESNKSLEDISSPIAPNASKMEVHSTNSLQPEFHDLHPSANVASPGTETDGAVPSAPRLFDTQSARPDNQGAISERAPTYEEPPMTDVDNADFDQAPSPTGQSGRSGAPTTIAPQSKP